MNGAHRAKIDLQAKHSAATWLARNRLNKDRFQYAFPTWRAVQLNLCVSSQSFVPGRQKQFQSRWLAQKLGQDCQSSLSIFFAGMTEVQPQCPTTLWHVRIERLSRHECHSALNSLGQQSTRVHVPRKREPKKQSSRRQLPGRKVTEMPLKRAGEIIALASIDRHNPAQPFPAVCSAELLQHEPLANAIAMQIRRLLQSREIGHQFWRSGEKPEAQSWRQAFRKRSLINPGCALQTRTNRRAITGVVDKIAIRIILEQGHQPFIAKLSQGFSFNRRIAAAGRILEGGNSVDEGWLSTTRPRCAGLAGIERKKVRPEKAKHLQRSQVGWGFECDRCTRIDKKLGHQVYALLRTGKNQDLFHGAFEADRPEIACDRLAQFGIAFAGTVLQLCKWNHIRAQYRKRFDGGKAAGKRDHPGPVDDRQYLADRRRVKICQAGGKGSVRLHFVSNDMSTILTYRHVIQSAGIMSTWLTYMQAARKNFAKRSNSSIWRTVLSRTGRITF